MWDEKKLKFYSNLGSMLAGKDRRIFQRFSKKVLLGVKDEIFLRLLRSCSNKRSNYVFQTLKRASNRRKLRIHKLDISNWIDKNATL